MFKEVTIEGIYAPQPEYFFKLEKAAFLGDKMFEGLDILANMTLRELDGFIRSWEWFKTTTNAYFKLGSKIGCMGHRVNMPVNGKLPANLIWSDFPRKVAIGLKG